jgi:Ca2+-binding EF-hand superfamily protein
MVSASQEAQAQKTVECRKIYASIDRDADGNISLLEFVEALRDIESVAAFVLPGVDCRSLMTDEDTFDTVNAIFHSMSGGKTRATCADFTSHFCRDADHTPKTSNMEEMRTIFQRIDADGSGTVSKLEFVEAVRTNATVASFVRPGLDSDRLMHDEDSFDAVSEIFDSAAGGKRRVDFADFSAYFRRTVRVPSKLRQPGVKARKDSRLFVIGTGFGQKVNPRQSQVLIDAGFQLKFMHELPNPEQPDFPIGQYLNQLKAALDEFQPDLVMCASKGDPYLLALWHSGLWTGPSLMINAHPSCSELPKNVRIVLAHGSCDEVYCHQGREALEQLVSTASPNHCLFYYVAGSGKLSNGSCSRQGDSHNMMSLVEYDCLPRLVDAALSHGESPELCMVRSWRDRLCDERLEAEAWLGYDTDQLQQLWVSRGHKGRETQKLFDVSPSSEEYAKIATVFLMGPKEPPAYGGCDQTVWARTRILRIERVENGLQVDGAERPYFESLRRSIEDQELVFEPGVHTRWLFHGTDAVESIVNNPMSGFQPLASGTRGASLWGSGTYFARDAKYVADGSFCKPAPDGTRRMIMCLVMTGMPCLGDPQHKGVLPMRVAPHRYDSSVDSLSSPEIHIIQHPGAAYPAYVITFL